MKPSRVVYAVLLLLTFCFSFAKSSHAQVTETYCSTDVPVDILSSTTVTSDLTVPDSGVITDVVVKLFINHAFRIDLIADLTSPESTEVNLFDNVGFEAPDNSNFGNSCGALDMNPNFVLDDDAAIPVSDFNSDNGFTTGNPVGTFIPQEPLSTFDGEQQSGTWTLSIEDDFFIDDGVLNCWCLEITREDQVRSIPTISQWGMIAFAGILGALGALFIHLRRKRAVV